MKEAKLTLAATSTLLVMAMTLPTTASADKSGADLDSFQSVPALAAPGNGRFKAKVKRHAQRIEYQLSYEDLGSTVLQAHIHFGNPWENGGIVAFLCTNLGNEPAPDVPLCPEVEGLVEGTIEPEDVIGPGGDRGIQPGDFEVLLDAIDAGATYVNVHTIAFPAGQIRSQID